MANGPDAIRLSGLCGALGIDRLRAAFAAAVSRHIFQSASHLHGMTKTAAPLMDLAAALFATPGKGSSRRTAAGNALRDAAPDLTDADRRAVLDVLRLAGSRRKRGAPLHELAPRLAAIASVAHGLDRCGKQDTRLLGVRDGGRSVELLLSDGRHALENAAGALEAARLWNERMPRPIRAVRICDEAEPVAELLQPTETVGRAIERICQRQIEQFSSRVYGVQHPEDIEYVHEMRVALRRLRAALRLFKGMLGGAATRLKVSAKRLAGVLGPVRDLDVFLAFLRDYAAGVPDAQRPFVDRLVASAEEERRRCYDRLAAYFASDAYQKFEDRYCPDAGAIVQPAGKGARRPVCDAAPRLLSKRLAQATGQPRSLAALPPAGLHALRIRCKRLRYAAEFFADLYPGALAEIVGPAKRLQDALGAVHDVDVYVERIRRDARAARPGGASDANAANALVGHLVNTRAASLAEAAKVWGQFAAAAAVKKTTRLIESPRQR